MMRTGRVLPGSVPRRGSRSASQTSPRSGIRGTFDGGELGVDLHALTPNLAGRLGESAGSEQGPGLPVHPFDSPPDIRRSGDLQGARVPAAFVEQIVRQLERDGRHWSSSPDISLRYLARIRSGT